VPAVDELKYQNRVPGKAAANSGEVLTVKFRYKKPEGDSTSILMTRVLELPADVGRSSENLTFASAVAGFGMLLRDSRFKGTLTFGQVIGLARAGKGRDVHGYKGEFLRLIEQADLLKRNEKRG
jgi:Ca-activated chloride channel family protein